MRVSSTFRESWTKWKQVSEVLYDKWVLLVLKKTIFRAEVTFTLLCCRACVCVLFSPKSQEHRMQAAEMRLLWYMSGGGGSSERTRLEIRDADLVRAVLELSRGFTRQRPTLVVLIAGGEDGCSCDRTLVNVKRAWKAVIRRRDTTIGGIRAFVVVVVLAKSAVIRMSAVTVEGRCVSKYLSCDVISGK